MSDMNGKDHLVRHEKDRPNGFDNDGYHPCDWPKPGPEDRLRVSVTTGHNNHHTTLTNGHDPSNGTAVVVVEDEDEDKTKKTKVEKTAAPLDTRLRHYVPFTDSQRYLNGDGTYVTIPEEDLQIFTSEKELLENLSDSKKHKPRKESIPLKEMAPPVYDSEDTKKLGNHKNGDSVWTTDKNPFGSDSLNEEKFMPGNGTSKPDDEVLMPANNHRKCLRGEKLYLTEGNRKLCQGKQRLIICGLIVIIIAVALLVGVLAATGILLAESETKNTRFSSSGQSQTVSAPISHAGHPFRSQPPSPSKVPQQSLAAEVSTTSSAVIDAVSQASSTVNPIVPEMKNITSQPLVPNALVGDFTITDENFTDDLGDNNSSGYKFLTQHLETELRRIFERNGGKFERIKILSLRPGSIKVKFVVIWRSSKGIIKSTRASQIMQAHLKKTQNLILGYTIDPNNVFFSDVVDECRINKGGCAYGCEWSYLTLKKTCTCKVHEYLLPDGVSCAEVISEDSSPTQIIEHATDSKTTETVLESETTSKPKISPETTDFPTQTHSPFTPTSTPSTEVTLANIEANVEASTSETSDKADLTTEIENMFATMETIAFSILDGSTTEDAKITTPESAKEPVTELIPVALTDETSNSNTSMIFTEDAPNSTVVSQTELNPESNAINTTYKTVPTPESIPTTALTPATTPSSSIITEIPESSTSILHVKVFGNDSTEMPVTNVNPPIIASINITYDDSLVGVTIDSLSTEMQIVTPMPPNKPVVDNDTLTISNIPTAPPILYETTSAIADTASAVVTEGVQEMTGSTDLKPNENQLGNATVTPNPNVSELVTKGSRSHDIETDVVPFGSKPSELLTTTEPPISLNTITSGTSTTTAMTKSIHPLETTPSTRIVQIMGNVSDVSNVTTESYSDDNTSSEMTLDTFENSTMSTGFSGETDYYDFNTMGMTEMYSTDDYSETVTSSEPDLSTIQDALFTTPETFTMATPSPTTQSIIVPENKTDSSISTTAITTPNKELEANSEIMSGGTQNLPTLMPEHATTTVYSNATLAPIENASSGLEIVSLTPVSLENATESDLNKTREIQTNSSIRSFDDQLAENKTDIPPFSSEDNVILALSTVSSSVSNEDTFSTDNYYNTSTINPDESTSFDSTTSDITGLSPIETNASLTSISGKGNEIFTDITLLSENTTESGNFTMTAPTSSSINSTGEVEVLTDIPYMNGTQNYNSTEGFNDTMYSNSSHTSFYTEVINATEPTTPVENFTFIDLMTLDDNSTEVNDSFSFDLSNVEVNTLLPIDFNLTAENMTFYGEGGNFTLNGALEEFNATMNETEEAGVVCNEEQHRCVGTNICLNSTFKCDGIPDCPEEDDETDVQCKTNCEPNFMCSNTSNCIMMEVRCDGIMDCDDGSDEKNCTPTACDKREVMCTDGSKCIKPGHICDWKYNCRDRSDEVGCVERTTCEQLGRFFCNDGLCIPWSLKCDGDYDCKDGEDEGNCTCLNDEFRCTDGKCLKSSSRCDGHQDCHDAEDEMGCVTVDEQGTVSTYEPYSGTWSLLCAEDWSLDDGHYLCQELGFGHALSTDKYRTSFNGTWMGMRRENLTSTSLWTERVSFVESCTSSLAAAVTCQKYDCGNYSGLLHRRKREESSSSSSHWPFIGYASTFQSSKGCLSEILTPIWLVTSAECLSSVGKEPHNGSEWYVRTNVGEGFVGDSAQNHEVLKILTHPHSSKFRSLILRDYDLALIRLKHALVFSDKIGAICLPEEQVPPGITCFSGVLGIEKPRAPPPTSISINSLALMVVDRESCNTNDQFNNQINQRMLCTRSSDSQSICDNDEGTPLMCLSEPNKWYLAGMLTYQRYCGIYNKLHPAVFSNLFPMRKFIDKITGQKQYDLPYDSSLYVILPPTTPSPTEPETTSMMTTEISTDVTTDLFPLIGEKLHYDSGDIFATAPDDFRSDNTSMENTTATISYENATDTTMATDAENITAVTLSDQMAFDMVNVPGAGLTNVSGEHSLQDEKDLNKTHGFIVININDTSPYFVEDLNSTSGNGNVSTYDGSSNVLFEAGNASITIDNEINNVTFIKVNSTDGNITKILIGPTHLNRSEETSTDLNRIDVARENISEEVFNATDLFDSGIVNATNEIKNANDSLVVFPNEDTNATLITVSNSSTNATEQPIAVFDNQTSSDAEGKPIINILEIPSNDSVHHILFNSTNDLSNITYTPGFNDTSDDSISFEINASDPNGDLAFTLFNVPEILKMEPGNMTNTEIGNSEKFLPLMSIDEEIIGQNKSGQDIKSEPKFLNATNDTLSTSPAQPPTNTTAFKILIDSGNVTTFIGDERDPDSFSRAMFPIDDLEMQNLNDSTLKSTIQPQIGLLINGSAVISFNPNETTVNTLTTEKAIPEKVFSQHELDSATCGLWESKAGVESSGVKNNSYFFVEWPALGFLKLIPEPKTCACVIISSRFVITSHKCLEFRDNSTTNSTKAQDWAFIGGYFNSTSSTLGSQYHMVDQIIPYPKDNAALQLAGNDFALVKLKEDIKWSKYSANVCLPQNDTTLEQSCFTPFWNKTLPDDNPGKAFHAMSTNITSPARCNYTDNVTLSNSFLCAIYDEEFNPCQVEFGLPLFCPNENKRWEIHGLSSIPTSCDTKSFGLHNSIRSIKNWITETIASPRS